jgi:glutamate dehydrogenase/leucine dehydrogenase
MAELQDKIISSSDAEVKNSAFEELQLLNLAKGKESFLEDKLQNNLGITSYIEINQDNINVTISSKEHNETIANEIMRSIQEEFEDKKNITIKFS